MAATKMFLIRMYSSSTHLKVFRSGFDMQEVFQTTSISVVWTSWKSSGLPGRLPGSLLTKSPFHNRSERFDLEDFWDDLPVSRLKYNDMKLTYDDLIVFNQMVLIFHSFKGFSGLEDFCDDLPVSRLKYNALDDFQEVFQTTSRKYSRRLPGSLPDDFQTTSRKSSRRLPFQSCGLPGSRFSYLEDFSDDLPVSRLKYNALDVFQEVFQTTSISFVWTSWKSSGLPGSRLDFLEVF
ncbi:hypothetical protein DY000_02055102 [Brassica cretica]|uniref:Uncharacterized protein n=1 Tax=Brassica cretica TaxID=69181 RepID=A0ABQ7AI25_BRACR|nr:hypothetical protein DY000_02055102 [Brassica cretica]